MKLLSKHTAWMGDGTFAIIPFVFLQLYTILTVVNNFALPLAFGLLPNKKIQTYVKFFSMIFKRVTSSPTSFNVDFELAVFSAAKKVFGTNIEIYGCYFHLSQSFFRNVQQKGFYIMFVTKPFFKKCFLLTQALAFLPIEDVLSGFLEVKNFAKTNCTEYLDFLSYIEEYYIGEEDKRSKKRKKPRYDIPTWNVHDRILNNKPRTSNKIERFNKEFSLDTGSYHLATNNLIEHLRLEQGHTESLIVQINLGKENSKNKLYQQLDDSYVNMLTNYDRNDIFSFLKNISIVIESFNEKLNKNRKKLNVSDENDSDNDN